MPRLIGPLEFALALGGLGALGFAFSVMLQRQQRYLSALAAVSAFPIAVWTASLVRQIIFELRTDGVVSSQMDSCTFVFMPILVVILSFVLVLLAAGFAALGTLDSPRRSTISVTFQTVFSRNQLLATAILVALGSWFGLANWVDWRINQPCL